MDKISVESFIFGILLTIFVVALMDDEVNFVNVLAIKEIIEKCPDKAYRYITVSGSLEGNHRETQIKCDDGSLVTQKHKYVSSGR